MFVVCLLTVCCLFVCWSLFVVIIVFVIILFVAVMIMFVDVSCHGDCYYYCVCWCVRVVADCYDGGHVIVIVDVTSVCKINGVGIVVHCCCSIGFQTTTTICFLQTPVLCYFWSW